MINRIAVIRIDSKHVPVLLEGLEELLYKLALQMEDLKGGPMTPERKRLDQKQKEVEELQHQISVQADEEGKNQTK